MGENAASREKAARDNQTLMEFWDGAFSLTAEEQAQLLQREPESLRELAPAEKLYRAASLLGSCKKVLDYGCGNAWAGIIAAQSGCADVTAVDVAPGAADLARIYARIYEAEEKLHILCVSPGWLQEIPSGTFDGIICSNVLDVVPTETAEDILRQLARAAAPGALVIIGLNYYLSPETANAKGLVLEDGIRLYVDGVLRLVSRTDEEWARLFSEWYTAEKLEHFAWPGENHETRRLFYLRRQS